MKTTGQVVKFDEVEIQKLFGHEAAENEDPGRLRSYFFKNKTYEKVVNELPLRILVGHKGIGKSALFEVAMQEEAEARNLCIKIRPDDVVSIGKGSDDFLELIRDWKNGITGIISQKALQSFGLQFDGLRESLNRHGGSVLDFLIGTFSEKLPANLSPAKHAVLAKFLETHEVIVYVDDLDRGWEGKKADIKRISALLNAVRDISSDSRGVRFRISLRSDVYYLSRTSDESTDKTEGSVVWYSWTNHEIFAVLVKRVESYFGRHHSERKLLAMHQQAMMQMLSSVMEVRFTGRGHWENAPMHKVLNSLVRKRPRDLVKLLTLAAREARDNGSEKITTKDLEKVFEGYSQGRLEDTFLEYRSELPDVKRLLYGMRPTKKHHRASHSFTFDTAALIKKIDSIRQQGVFKFASGEIASSKQLAAFMYKINFITARKTRDGGGYIIRKYFEENRYLANEFRDFGFDWEIHPAYRWALQPDDIWSVLTGVEIELDEAEAEEEEQKARAKASRE